MKKTLTEQFSGIIKKIRGGLLIMKLITFFLIIGTFAVYASTYSQETKLDLRVKNSSVEEILSIIENSSEFIFFYDAELFKSIENRNISLRNAEINEVLSKIFEKTPVDYLIDDRQVFLFRNDKVPVFSPVPGNEDKVLQPRTKELSGAVRDESGQPMVGVSIIVKGTTIGTITGINGEFSLNVPLDAQAIVFSFVGMVTREIVIEVVVVGYGTLRRVNLTGAVDVITNEKLANRQSSTVSQLLQGLSPGFNFDIDADGFQPGASMNITIRGMGSLNGGEPYILIDGFPGDINKLNPEDIETVSVLKDAAASAIYGARAPYGVILITTKRGSKNERLSASYSGNVFINTPQKLPSMLDSYTWTRVLNEAGVNRGGRPFTDETIDLVIAYQNEDWDFIRPFMPEGVTHFGAFPVGNTWNNANRNYANNDWYDLMYGHSVNQKHDFSVQGGSANSSYYFSAGYLGQGGVLNYGTDDFQRINLMGKLHTVVASWWDFDWEARLSHGNRVRPNMTNQGDYNFIFHNIAKMYPITPMYDGWGNYHQSTSIPFLEEGGNESTQDNDHWQTFRTELRPVKGWKINADLAYNSYSMFRSNPENSVFIGQVDKTFTPHGTTVPNSIEQVHANNDYITSNVYTSFQFDFNEIHNFYVLAGTQYEYGRQRLMTGFKNNMIVQEVPSLQTATGDPILSESLNHRATAGYFSRLTYNYKEKYLFEANSRYDGSSVFRESNRWGFFPSFSLGWNIHRESFWEPVKPYINTFKVRGSWGQLGNQNVAPYSDLELIPLQTDQLNWILNYGDSRPIGYTTAPGIINRNLTWETATTKNLGFNLTFLNNRLQTDFDLFERTTTSMIGPSEAKPGVLGANVPRDNNSTLRTTGWELALRWRQDFENTFSYFLNANMYDSKSEVTKYYNPTGSLSTWYVGQQVGEIWGYTVNDLFKTADEVTQYLNEVDLSFIFATWRPGDVKFEDINGDGKVNNGSNTIDDYGDMSIIGNNSPRYQYGLSGGADSPYRALP